MITKKEYEQLKKYHEHLNRAYNADFVYGMTLAEAEELFDIYNKMFNKNEKSTSCTRCRLRIAKLLGAKYFEYKEKNDSKIQRRKTIKSK